MHISNALPRLQAEIQAGRVDPALGRQAETLVLDLQKEVVEISGRTGESGIYRCRPVWADSSAETTLKFDPQNRPTAEEPLKGHPVLYSSYSQSGRWGFDREKTLNCSDQGIVFEQRNDGRSTLKISFNADGTCKVESNSTTDPHSWCPG